MTTPSFTTQDLEQYNRIKHLIDSGNILAVEQCMHIHTIAPPERRLNVMQMLLEKDDLILAQKVFPYLDWRIERHNLKNIAQKNSSEWTELFYEYANPSDNNWQAIMVMVEENAYNALDVVLQYEPPLYFIEQGLQQSIRRRYTDVLNVFISHIHKYHPTFNLFQIAFDTLSEGMDCSLAFANCFDNKSINNILPRLMLILNHNENFNDIQKASILRNYTKNCSELTYITNEHKTYTERTFEILLEGALLLNDKNYLQHLLHISSINYDGGHIKNFFNSYDFFTDICAAKIPPNEHAYLFEQALLNKHLDIALFLYDTSVRREYIEDIIEKYNTYEQNNPSIDNLITPFLNMLEHRQLLFDTLAQNPEAPTHPKRKL